MEFSCVVLYDIVGINRTERCTTEEYGEWRQAGTEISPIVGKKRRCVRLTLVGQHVIPQQSRTDKNIYTNDWKHTTVFNHVTYRDDSYSTACNLLLQYMHQSRTLQHYCNEIRNTTSEPCNTTLLCYPPPSLLASRTNP